MESDGDRSLKLIHYIPLTITKPHMHTVFRLENMFSIKFPNVDVGIFSKYISPENATVSKTNTRVSNFVNTLRTRFSTSGGWPI